MRITELLGQLASVWAAPSLKEYMGYEFIKEIDYEDVEKVCLEGLP